VFWRKSKPNEYAWFFFFTQLLWSIESVAADANQTETILFTMDANDDAAGTTSNYAHDYFKRKWIKNRANK
jgi:hypothetical protein